MREVVVNPSFLRDVKRLKRRHCDMALLSGRYRDHGLKGALGGFRELHVQGDIGDVLGRMDYDGDEYLEARCLGQPGRWSSRMS